MQSLKVKIETESIVISNLDYTRLLALFECAKKKGNSEVEELDEKLINAEIVDPKAIPQNVITMNSRVICRLPDRMMEDKELTLVYPFDANIGQNKISVFSHMGRAILGRRVGEIVSWKGNDGFQRRLKIQRMDYQPEDNGDWHL